MGFCEVSNLHRSPDLFSPNRVYMLYWSRSKPAGPGSACFPPDFNFESILHEEGMQSGAKEGYNCWASWWLYLTFFGVSIVQNFLWRWRLLLIKLISSIIFCNWLWSWGSWYYCKRSSPRYYAATLRSIWQVPSSPLSSSLKLPSTF